MLAARGSLNIYFPHCPPHTVWLNCRWCWQVHLWDARERELAYSTTRAPVQTPCAGMQDDSSETWPHSLHRGYKQRELRKTRVDLFCPSTCNCIYISSMTSCHGQMWTFEGLWKIPGHWINSCKIISVFRWECMCSKKRGIGSKDGILAWESESSQEESLGQP